MKARLEYSKTLTLAPTKSESHIAFRLHGVKRCDCVLPCLHAPALDALHIQCVACRRTLNLPLSGGPTQERAQRAGKTLAVWEIKSQTTKTTKEDALLSARPAIICAYCYAAQAIEDGVCTMLGQAPVNRASSAYMFTFSQRENESGDA